MTDRELLEFAAKAAGIEAHFEFGSANAMALVKPRGFQVFWNPLADDADALRLAVKLGLTLELRGCNSMHPYAVVYDCMRGIDLDEQPDDGDPYAATRRAIVRAAAAIGKQMP